MSKASPESENEDVTGSGSKENCTQDKMFLIFKSEISIHEEFIKKNI